MRTQEQLTMEPSVVTEDSCAVTEPVSEASIPTVKDAVSFDSQQAACLRHIERLAQTEITRKKRNWERQVERMR